MFFKKPQNPINKKYNKFQLYIFCHNITFPRKKKVSSSRNNFRSLSSLILIISRMQLRVRELKALAQDHTVSGQVFHNHKAGLHVEPFKPLFPFCWLTSFSHKVMNSLILQILLFCLIVGMTNEWKISKNRKQCIFLIVTK